VSVDTAATQDVQRPKFGSGFQRRGIEADLQRYANALPSLVCIAASTILLDLGLGPGLSPFNEDQFSRVRVRPETRY